VLTPERATGLTAKSVVPSLSLDMVACRGWCTPGLDNRVRGVAMYETLLLVGIACIIGAIVGGGLKLVNVELPLIASLPRQMLLALSRQPLRLARPGSTSPRRLPRAVPGW
jgi:hypothetical protein